MANNTAPLPASWSMVAWDQGYLCLPIPPHGQFSQSVVQAGETFDGYPLLAQASVSSSDVSAERLMIAALVVISFDGSLQQWIDAERKNRPTPLALDEETVFTIKTANRPAVFYQWTGADGVEESRYAVDIATTGGLDTALLIISTRHSSDPTFYQMAVHIRTRECVE